MVWHLVKSCCVYFQNHYFAFFFFHFFIFQLKKLTVLHNSSVSFFYNLLTEIFIKKKKSTITDLHVKPWNQIHPSFWNSFWIQIVLAKIIWPLRLDLVIPKVAVCLMAFTPKGKGNMSIWNYHLVILLEYPPQSWSVRTERATLGWTMMETKTKFKIIEQNRTMLELNPIFQSLVGVDLPTCKYRKNEKEWFSDPGHVIAILHTETELWVELSTFYVIIALILYVWRHPNKSQAIF